MSDQSLEAAVAVRFRSVNGDHQMTDVDDEYVTASFVSVEAAAEAARRHPDELRRMMLANRLPLPGYIRSDGRQMVPADLLELSRQAGGFDRLPAWFGAQFESPAKAVEEWENYLAGHYVCLCDVTPENMNRKDELVEAIEAALAEPRPTSPDWVESLHRLVDDLDVLERPFAPYDRLRFGGPVSRDRLIDDVRRSFPRPPGAPRPEPAAASEVN